MMPWVSWAVAGRPRPRMPAMAGLGAAIGVGRGLGLGLGTAAAAAGLGLGAGLAAGLAAGDGSGEPAGFTAALLGLAAGEAAGLATVGAAVAGAFVGAGGAGAGVQAVSSATAAMAALRHIVVRDGAAGGRDLPVLLAVVQVARRGTAHGDKLFARWLGIARLVRRAAGKDRFAAVPGPRKVKARMRLWQGRPVESGVTPGLASVGADFDAGDPTAPAPGEATNLPRPERGHGADGRRGPVDDRLGLPDEDVLA